MTRGTERGTERGARDDDAPIREPIGGYLAKQRELRGITPEQLAELTRIPLRSIERLEAGSFDDNLDGFVRGFVRTVAEALGLDPADTLARTLDEPEPEAGASMVGGSAKPVAWIAAAALAVFALAQVTQLAVGWIQRDDAPPETVLRRDPVRALAEAQGLGVLDEAEEAERGVPPVSTAPPEPGSPR